MTGFITTRILGKVTSIKEGTAKTGKAWFRANVACGIYDYASKKYVTHFVNVVAFDKVAEAMKKLIQPGCALFAEGTAKAADSTKTNGGREIPAIDLVARDWYLAGIVPDREQQPAESVEEKDESDPFSS